MGLLKFVIKNLMLHKINKLKKLFNHLPNHKVSTFPVEMDFRRFHTYSMAYVKSRVKSPETALIQI